MPPSPTQPSTLGGMGNEYHPKCGDALQLGSRGRYGFGYGMDKRVGSWFEITKMLIAVLTNKLALAQCWFPGLAIFNVKI